MSSSAAGYGYRAAAVEEGDDPDIRTLFETDVFGVVSLLKAVLPGMRGPPVRRHRQHLHYRCPDLTCWLRLLRRVESRPSSKDCPAPSTNSSLSGMSVTVVEPGAFRTDFAGRSLTQSTTVNHDHSDTAGNRPKEAGTGHGTKPGDPAKAAQAIMTAVESDEPPAFLILGTDALTTYRRLNQAFLDLITTWERTATSADIQTSSKSRSALALISHQKP